MKESGTLLEMKNNQPQFNSDLNYNISTSDYSIKFYGTCSLICIKGIPSIKTNEVEDQEPFYKSGSNTKVFNSLIICMIITPEVKSYQFSNLFNYPTFIDTWMILYVYQ